MRFIFPMIRLMFSRRWWWTTLIVILGIGLTIRLGFWQLDRNAGRMKEIAHAQAIQALPVLDLNARPLAPDLETMEYRQAVVSGVYDFEHQVALRNQVRPRMTGNDPGVALVTPLIMPDGQAVLVNRGWIPLQYHDPATWGQFDVPGTVQVAGVIRLSMAKGEFGSILVDPTLSPGVSRLDLWNFIDLTRLQQQIPYPILTIYIQQAPAANQVTVPYPLAAEPDLDPGAHIGFALQWFFYAGLLLFGYPVWLNKQKTKTLPTTGEG